MIVASSRSSKMSPPSPRVGLVIILLCLSISSIASTSATKTTRTKLIRRSISADQEEFTSAGRQDEAARAASLVAVAVASSNSGGGGEKPRLIPLVASDSGYSENSSVNILCTVSQGHHESLTFDWFKEGQSLSSTYHQLNSDSNVPLIESQPDHSLLRISRVKSQHSGRYTCSAKNQFGQDSSSVNLAVNVKLQWSKEPPKEIVVSLNQELKVDCLAQGEPRPQMRWEKLDSPLMSSVMSSSSSSSHQTSRLHAARPSSPLMLDPSSLAGGKNQLAASKQSVLVSSNRYLAIQRAKETDSGVYECIASNSHDADLRKLVYVQVRGPPKILPIATADSYPEGSLINLICTVSGGQRNGLGLKWMINGEELDDGKLSGENVSIGSDDGDISILKIKNATHANSGKYTCTATNPLGQDSTSVNIVINVELKWTKIPHDAEVGLNQELSMECDALGTPQPTIEWFKHSSDKSSNSGMNLVSKGKLMKITRAQHKDSGLYECSAKNGVHDALRKIVQVKVRE